MVVDLDEFVYARNGFETIPDYLRILSPDVSTVIVWWKGFGSNGHIQQPLNVVEGFVKRSDQYRCFNGYNKYIGRTTRLREIELHVPSIFSGRYIIPNGGMFNPWGADVYRPTSELDDHCLHLNHYQVQSFEWFMAVKATRGDAHSINSDNVRNLDYFKERDTNHILDTELRDKTRKLKSETDSQLAILRRNLEEIQQSSSTTAFPAVT